ncbi:bifunctional 2-polyprenyl-6-hydroxyphenol methylase/3-demethylubiquinol 3-O-methyltransferase UbiG [Geobacter sp. SVR]|uniref:class I SAM-dependent methyltransferase n=1 Tax=Geobacter sp. SVR TaxID=2495594 RepID=UPI00143F049D|nr:class I SAM-dependent methyltransferase [Geobacter sp. SVR]BCS52943.1 SAM-dependent methyltransferase [Geobacter sp. SVR]GCF84327.1 SAM-dependent methyltransferase [Geobacter sp. SVR]
MSDPVLRHYELYPYPHYPLLASVRRCDTYALNLEALWARFNGELPPSAARRILIAGCGSFAPYPFAVANPTIPITALDLSATSLKRARLHCLLHGRRNVSFQVGSLLDPAMAAGRFGLIDAYGVLHHLPDPLTGLQALASRLAEGGILRIMVYSRYARREEESIRRAFRLLGVRTPTEARRLIGRSKPGSRLRNYVEASSEVSFAAGLADALLHPQVSTFRIIDLMELVGQSGLQPLQFAHCGALPEVEREIGRISELEARHESPGNFVLYLGKNTAGPVSGYCPSRITLNPCLRSSVSGVHLAPVRIAGRLGWSNPLLDRRERSFLRQFIQPVQRHDLPQDALEKLDDYLQALLLISFRT